jgi:hypothetical protein
MPRRRPKDRTSMRNGVTLGLLVLGSPLLVASGGCTRTYDGSLVPAYALSSSHSATNVSLGLVPADPLPPDRLYRFPPPPPPVPGEISDVADPAPSRTAGLAIGGFIPRIETEAPRPVTCRNESADGRIRFVCD